MSARIAAVIVALAAVVAPSPAAAQLGPSPAPGVEETPREEGRTPAGPSDLPDGAAANPDEEARAKKILAEISEAGGRVVMRGIDKLTGEVETFTASVGEETFFRRMRIDVKTCTRRIADEKPEAAAFLQIFDTKPEPAERSFSGWMFASSPALSAMDHPRYDVWVLSCEAGS